MKERTLLFLLKCVAMLPLGVLYIFSDLIYLIVYHVVGYRVKLVRENLSTSFPQRTETELRQIERKFYAWLCDVMVETVKVLHISDRQMNKRVTVTGYEDVNESVEAGKSVVIMLAHYGNWEWVQEISRYFTPKAYMGSIYRTANHSTGDNIFIRIRERWHAHIIPQDKAVRVLLDRDLQPWIFGFIADQRPRYANENAKLEFLNHETYFITGPEDIGKKVGADFYYLEMLHPGRGYYNITLKKLEPLHDGLPYPITRAFWKEFEKTIEAHPAYWLWSHKRWNQNFQKISK